MLENYDNYRLFNLSFSGVVPKICCENNGKLFIVKSDNPGEYKCISEYLASKLASILGLECQKVSLGFRNGLLSCGIELFNNGSSIIHHYYDVNDSSLDSIDLDARELPYTLEFIFKVLSTYKSIEITNEEIISNFITMCIFDCLIGNYDRHWGNWGFIGRNKDCSICPLFDNGSSLYPKLTIEEISNIMLGGKELYQSIYEFPKSQIRRTKKKKFLYKDLMECLVSLGYKKEFKEFINRFESNKDSINNLFKDPILESVVSKERLEFLNYMVNARFELLIKDVFVCN